MLVVAVASQKGGVGKTTVAVNLAMALSDQLRVVLVDMDAQGSATYALGSIPGNVAGFDQWLDGKEVLLTSPIPYIPGGPETSYVQWPSAEPLKEALCKLESDLVLLDCPPTLGASTVAAMMVADRVLIPVLADPLGLVGLAQALNILEQVHPSCPVEVVRSRYRPQLKMTVEADQQLVANPRFVLLATCIPENVAIAESAGVGQPLLQFAPKSRGTIAFKTLAAEVLNKWGLQNGRI